MASTSGYLTQGVKSTVSSPTVNYSAEYSATRANNSVKTVSVKLTLRAWLNSSRSMLGTGIKLTVFARINGGAWQSVVIKDSSAVWNGTSKHKASLTITAGVPEDKVRVDFYVSRYGSNFGGTAGILGSAKNPKSYTASLPEYDPEFSSGSSAPSDGSAAAPADGYIYINVGGVWKRAIVYVNVGGAWKKTSPYVKIGGVWKPT